jgi:hypothetical protein
MLTVHSDPARNAPEKRNLSYFGLRHSEDFRVFRPLVSSFKMPDVAD